MTFHFHHVTGRLRGISIDQLKADIFLLEKKANVYYTNIVIVIHIQRKVNISI